MTLKTLFVATIAIISSVASAQDLHKHTHQQNEIGLSLGSAYEIDHKEWKPALHTHFFRAFTPHSRWAWGGGLEYLLGDETHFEIGAGLRFTPVDKLQFSMMPGVSITDEARFSLHTEMAFELVHFGNFHMGPVVGYALTSDHSHYSIGVHAAFAFGK